MLSPPTGDSMDPVNGYGCPGLCGVTGPWFPCFPHLPGLHLKEAGLGAGAGCYTQTLQKHYNILTSLQGHSPQPPLCRAHDPWGLSVSVDVLEDHQVACDPWVVVPTALPPHGARAGTAGFWREMTRVRTLLGLLAFASWPLSGMSSVGSPVTRP